MEWDSEMCLSLLDEYKKHPVLWNPQHGFYYNKGKKHKSWVSIAQVMGISSEEAKKKMDSMLSSFRREKAKQKNTTGKGTQKPYKSKWFAFKRMAFLLDKDEPRPTSSFMEASGDAEISLEGEVIPTAVVLNSVNSSKSFNSERENACRLKSTACTNKEDYAFRLNNRVMDIVDECSIYGDFVGHKIRNLRTSRLRAIAQNRISNVLFELEMSPENEGYSSSSSSVATNLDQLFVTHAENNTIKTELQVDELQCQS